MTLGVYSNNFIPRDKYAIKDNASSSGMDKDGQGSFLEEFVKDETDKRLKTDLDREEKQLEDTGLESYTMPSRSAIHDYIDNFLLINAEQVACSNMTQHLIKSDELKVTLGFLNTEAAKNMFQGRKRPNFDEKQIPQFKTMPLTSRSKNFFSTGIDSSTNNFFIK